MIFGPRNHISPLCPRETSFSSSSISLISQFGIGSPTEPATAVRVGSQPRELQQDLREISFSRILHRTKGTNSVEARPCLTFTCPLGQSASYCTVGSGPSGAAQEKVLVTLLRSYLPLFTAGYLVMATIIGGTRCKSVIRNVRMLSSIRVISYFRIIYDGIRLAIEMTQK